MWRRCCLIAATAVPVVAACTERAPTCAEAFAGHPDGKALSSGQPAASVTYREAITGSRGYQAALKRVLEEARRFRGDADVLALRWASAHRITAEHSGLGPVSQGVVPIAAATKETSTDEDRVVKGGRVGALRVLDGKLLWSRSGQVGESSQAAASVRVALAEGTKGGLSTGTGRIQPRSAGLDLTTGRMLWCASAPNASAMPWSMEPAGAGTAVGLSYWNGSQGGALQAVRSGDGTLRWSAPGQQGAVYRGHVIGDGMAAATSATTLPFGSAGLDTELGIHRLSDGARVWRLGDRAGPGHPWRTERWPIGISKGLLVVAERTSGPASAKDVTRLAVYRTADARLRWARPVPAASERTQVKVVGSQVLLVHDGRFSALRIVDGRPVWNHGSDHQPELRQAVTVGRYLYAPQHERPGLAVLDLQRGTTRTALGFLKDSINTDLAVGDGILLLQYANLTLAFDLPRR